MGNQTDKDETRSERSRYWRLLVGLMFLAVLIVPIVALMWGSGAFRSIYTMFFPIVHYSEAFAEITVNGERHRLTSITKCSLTLKAPFGGLVAGPNYKVVRGGLLLHRLPTGGGLVLLGPYLCSSWDKEHRLDDKGQRAYSLEEYFREVPLHIGVAFKLDDLEKPTRITEFRKEYFEQPGADFQIHKIGYRLIENGTVADDEKRIPFLKGRIQYSDPGHCDNRLADWRAFISYAVPKSVWSKMRNYQHLINETEPKELGWWKETSRAISKFPSEPTIVDEVKKEIKFLKRPHKEYGAVYYTKYNRDVRDDFIRNYQAIIYDNYDRIIVRSVSSTIFDVENQLIRGFDRLYLSKDRICR